MDLDQHLVDTFNDPRSAVATRKLARELLMQWRQGVVPSSRDLDSLAKLYAYDTAPPRCERLGRDNGCGWLRAEGETHGLHLPPIGERATCQYLGQQPQCPGFKRQRS
jgi:hypothetical protein